MSTLTRCDRSYPLVHPELVEAMILPDDSRVGCIAELREISAGGAKLVLPGPPELAANCRVRLTSSKLARVVEFPGQIDWARPNSAGDWLVECEFQPRLADAQFAELLSSGLLERRASVRIQTRIPVEVEWLPGRARVQGIVRDLSAGGLCLCLVTKEAPPETRDVCVIAPTPQGDLRLQVRVRWSLVVGTDHMIGCQFMQASDFALLRKLQPGTKDKDFLHEHSRASKPRGDS